MMGRQCFDYCSFVVTFEIGKCKSSSFILLSQTVLAIQGPLRYHINFKMDFSIYEKNTIGIFDGNALAL